MEIRKTDTTNFGAKYISPATIQKKRLFVPIYDNEITNFVQLGQNQADIDCLYTFSQRFSNSSFGTQMANRLKIKQRYQVYAFTRQQDNFEKLDPKDILGLCGGSFEGLESDYPWFFISHLEAKTRNNEDLIPLKRKVKFLGINFNVEEQYKGIGTELLKKVLTQLIGQKENLSSVEVRSLHSAKSFYRYLGWEEGLLVDSMELTPFRLSRRHFDDFLSGDSIYKHD